MTRIRSVLVLALGIVAGALCLLALPRLGIAHAQAVAAPAEGTPGAIAHDWAFWVAAGLAGLAGLRAIVTSALDFFKWLAPKTKTTVDDTIRNDLQLAHDKLDALAATVGQLLPSAKPATASGTIGGAS